MIFFAPKYLPKGHGKVNHYDTIHLYSRRYLPKGGTEIVNLVDNNDGLRLEFVSFFIQNYVKHGPSWDLENYFVDKRPPLTGETNTIFLAALSAQKRRSEHTLEIVIKKSGF